MATSTSYDAIITNIDQMIQDHQTEIDNLVAAKQMLTKNGESSNDEPVEKPRKRRTRSEAVKVESEPSTKRRSKVSERRNSRQKSNGQEYKKDEILTLYEQGMKPKEIAEELDSHVGYVYLVLRQNKQDS